jgi:hypothetical protein
MTTEHIRNHSSSREEAIEKATAEFVRAAATAGLDPAPVVRAEAISEEEDDLR